MNWSTALIAVPLWLIVFRLYFIDKTLKYHRELIWEILDKLDNKFGK